MRTLIPLLLVAILSYAGWYYWQAYTDAPLQEKLLLHDAAAMQSIRITAFGEEAFQLVRAAGTEDWTVKQGITELYDQSDRIKRLLTVLDGLQTDSVMRRFSDKGLAVLEVKGPDRSERIELAFPDTGPVLGRISATGDVFALRAANTANLLNLLRFETYRERGLLRLDPERVDSLVATHQDSLLWRVTTGNVSSLAKTFIAPASAPSAEHFDEIMDRDKYFATLHLYAQGNPHRITVYRDSLWPKPYVLVGEDFPRRYWALDSLR